MKFCYNSQVLPFLNYPKDLDPSNKMDLDFWNYFGRKKTTVLQLKKLVSTFLEVFHVPIKGHQKSCPHLKRWWTLKEVNKYCNMPKISVGLMEN